MSLQRETNGGLITHHMGVRTSITINKFLIIETGTYNPMYRRAYQTNMDAETLMAIKEKVRTGGHINPQLLGGLADRFITPSAFPETNQFGKPNEIFIPNNWGERRLRFMLEVETSFGVGGSIIEIIQGYSDYLGVSHTGSIDPNMVFHINSVLKVRKQVENTAFGKVNRMNIVDSNHVLVDNNNPGIYSPDYAVRMRPEDVFTSISLGPMLHSSDTYVDTRTMNNSNPVLSNRKNSIPTNYLSDIMTGYQSAIIDPTNHAGDFQTHMSSARAYTATSSIQTDAFIKALSNIQGTPITSSFTFGNLVSLDTNVSHKTKFARRSGPNISVNSNFVGIGGAQPWDTEHQAGSTQSWENRDLNTQTAVVLGNAVPALLMELALTGIYFTSTNRNLGNFGQTANQITTMIGDWQSFSDIDMTAYIQSFKNRFEREILPGLTYLNQLDYWFEMKVDLLGETWIKVSINGSDLTLYNQPSFADALAVPVLSNNKDAVTSMATDVELFLNEIIPTDMPSMKNQNSNYSVPII